MDDNTFANLIKSNTYFKSKSGSCIDLKLTNKPEKTQHTGMLENIISDHKNYFYQNSPNKLQHRNCKSFESNSFLWDNEQLTEKILFIKNGEKM